MSEVDWSKVYTTRLATCCQRAAADLNLSVTTPFVITDEANNTHSFVAHFPALGGGRGILVCLASDWEKLHEIAHRQGYTCVGILPDTCSSYDRARWERVIREWEMPSGADQSAS